jgi:hypothetical protein
MLFDIDYSENQPVKISTSLQSLSDHSFIIDIWSFNDQEVEIEIDDFNAGIEILKVIAHNYLKLKFLLKAPVLQIKKLMLTCAGIEFSGGADIEFLEINSNGANVVLKNELAKNIIINYLPQEDEKVIQELLHGVNVIPGCGEYVLDLGEASLKDLQLALPNAKWISPIVSWFADSLDISSAKLKPGIDQNYKHISHDSWKVGDYSLKSAHKISFDTYGNVNYGGSINDQSVLNFLNIAKEFGFKVMFYPFIMIDIPGKPWRGYMSGSAEDVERFYLDQYRPFILHYAHLVCGKVDAFLIGSELRGLTKIHDHQDIFPFVKYLVQLAFEIKGILGPQVKISYAADWSEYHSIDGCLRPLDSLWGCSAIDFVGIDAYFPLTDTRQSRMSIEEIKHGWRSGEGYDYYLSGNIRVPFVKGEDWNCWKNLEYWWNSEHLDWHNSTSTGKKTEWQPRMKPIWFTEFGFPSIDKAPNKPNVFFNPQSSDGGAPMHSNSQADFAIQRKALRASLEYWQNSFVENVICWSWDVRGNNWYVSNNYSDGNLWKYGHWIDGKIGVNKISLFANIKVHNLTINAINLDIIDPQIELTGQFVINIEQNLVVKASGATRPNHQLYLNFKELVNNVGNHIDAFILRERFCDASKK